MAVRRVVTLPEGEQILRARCAPVAQIDERVQTVIQDLLDTFETQAAYGIAAPQIGEADRIVLCRLEDEQPPLVMINPEITQASGEIKDYDGCLSIPGIYADTRRAAEITLRFLTPEGEQIEMVLGGFAARVVQHEVDHVDGVLFLDRLDQPRDLYVLEQVKEGEYEAVPLPPEEERLVFAFRRPLPAGALTWAAPPRLPRQMRPARK